MAKNSRRNRINLEALPDGAIPAEELQKILARQDKVIKSEVEPENPDSRPLNIPPNAAGMHAGPEMPVSKNEFRVPKFLFEKALSSAIRSTYFNIKEGFALITEINSKKKELEIKKGMDGTRLNFILEKIKLVDPDNEKILSELKRLNDLNAKEYDIAAFRGKIDSSPDIVSLKNSERPESEKQEQYEKFVKGSLGHEVREVFRQNEILGQVAKIAIHLRKNIGDGLLELVDRKEDSVQKEGVSGPSSETAVREPVQEKGPKEELSEIEAQIETDFSDEEKEFKDLMIRNYESELRAAKNKREKNKGIADKKWAEWFRDSYISSIKTIGLDKNRWGTNGPLATEKAGLLGKYLGLKLPMELPEEKIANKPTKNENVFSKEKSKEFIRLLKIAGSFFREWVKKSKEWGDEYGDEGARKKALIDQLQIVLVGVIAEDPELKKYFTEESAPLAVERVVNNIKIYNNIV